MTTAPLDSLSPQDIDRAATLLDAATAGARLADLPEALRPATWDDAYAVQDAVIRRMGPVVGWKVGATSPEAEPFRGAITAQTLFESPVDLARADYALFGVEAELAYRFTRDLPPRDTPWTEAEVAAAIGSVHAVIEIIDSRFLDMNAAAPLSRTADRMNHGALIVGTGRTDWAAIDPPHQAVSLRIEGRPPVEVVGGNSAGHPMRMLVWMANVGARAHGGLRAGQIVTTGSCTGTIYIDGGHEVVAEFPGVGAAELTLR
jgi:2-keto-4-pentenoate hydratase